MKTLVRTQGELASALQLSTRMVRLYAAEGMPGVPGAYCVEDCRAWLDARAERKRAAALQDDSDRDFSDADSPSLERYRAAKADLAEFERDVKRGELIPASVVQQMMQHAAAVIRTFSEKLGRSHPDLQVEFEELLIQVGDLVDAVVDGTDSGTIDMDGCGQGAVS